MVTLRAYVFGVAVLAVTCLIAAPALAGEGKAAPAATPTTMPANDAPAVKALADKPVAVPAPTTAPAPTTVPAPAEPVATEIPLSKVWAYEMPGTLAMEMPMAADGKTYTTTDGKLLSEILASLKDYGNDVRGGFAVTGVNSPALLEAHKVLVDSQSPNATLDRSSKLSLVFFSHQPGLYVNLKKIVQKGAVVEITYQFVARDTKDLTPQLAIIPLGPVPAGMLRVVLRSEANPNIPQVTPVDPHELAGETTGPAITFAIP